MPGLFSKTSAAKLSELPMHFSGMAALAIAITFNKKKNKNKQKKTFFTMKKAVISGI